MDRRYIFLESRSGDTVPALITPAGNAPLHSMVDPKREALRLVSTITDDTGFIIFFGLGGGFAPNAALAHSTARVTVIDFNIEELLSAIDCSKLLNNERFCLLADPSPDKIKSYILDKYIPALFGGIKIIPLRTRTEHDLEKFNTAAAVIEEAIKNVAADYSVQAHFGRRWFSNIIRNIKEAGTIQENILIKKPCKEAAIVAAGPSLDQQIPVLAEYKMKQVFIICSDTALPSLLHHGIEPDAVVSIDCQHISYYHFMNCNIKNIPVFMDIASPPLLRSFSKSPFFFISGHPLALYISENWQQLPHLDTSGGNVTYACLSLAEKTGAQNITLFGADFSYIGSRIYARGTYIYPFFEKKQNRLSPLEALFSAFLYRSPFLPPEPAPKLGAKRSVEGSPQDKFDQKQGYYETSQLRFYRNNLEKKASAMEALITAAQGYGAPINICKKQEVRRCSQFADSGTHEKKFDSIKFLEQYRNDIISLPAANGADYYHQLNNINDRKIFATMLPFAAALKHRNPEQKTNDLIEETKCLSVKEIDRILACN